MNDLQKFARIELSKRDFFVYCNTKAPDFYKKDRTFLVEFCTDLQTFLQSDEHEILVVNMPPRHGKSRTIGNFVEWVLGNDQTHYIQKHSVHGLKELKQFINAFVTFIDADLAYQDAVSFISGSSN